VLALNKVGDRARDALPAVLAALQGQEKDAAVRLQAVRLAGRLGAQEAKVVPVLADVCLKDTSVETRLAAMQELAQLGTAAKAAAPALRQLADNDSRSSIREAAAAALKKVQP